MTNNSNSRKPPLVNSLPLNKCSGPTPAAGEAADDRLAGAAADDRGRRPG